MRTHDGQKVIFKPVQCINEKLILMAPRKTIMNPFDWIYYCRECGYWEVAEAGSDSSSNKYLKHSF